MLVIRFKSGRVPPGENKTALKQTLVSNRVGLGMKTGMISDAYQQEQKTPRRPTGKRAQIDPGMFSMKSPALGDKARHHSSKFRPRATR